MDRGCITDLVGCDDCQVCATGAPVSRGAPASHVVRGGGRNPAGCCSCCNHCSATWFEGSAIFELAASHGDSGIFEHLSSSICASVENPAVKSIEFGFSNSHDIDLGSVDGVADVFEVAAACSPSKAIDVDKVHACCSRVGGLIEGVANDVIWLVMVSGAVIRSGAHSCFDWCGL